MSEKRRTPRFSTRQRRTDMAKFLQLDAYDVHDVLNALENYRDSLDSFLSDSEGDDVQKVRKELARINTLIRRARKFWEANSDVVI